MGKGRNIERTGCVYLAISTTLLVRLTVADKRDILTNIQDFKASINFISYCSYERKIIN